MTTPLDDPASILAVLFAAVLLAPVLARPLRVPPLIVLIGIGFAVGPTGAGLLERDGLVALLGTGGLLFLMFMAGVELDLDDFASNRAGAGAFGIATFVLPMGLGTAIHLALGFDGVAALLLGSCWASHTLLAYPVFQRLGVVQDRAVSVSVGATIVTDTLALLALVAIVAADGGDLDAGFVLRTLPAVGASFAVVLVALPRVADHFFRRAGRDRTIRFLFVTTALYASAALTEAAGVEAIIGAFLAGLALNRLIPRGGLLFERLEFFSSTFLVPIFLLSVGMLVDPAALTDPDTLVRAFGFCVAVIGGKAAAAFLAGRFLGFDLAQIAAMFSLSVAQAAATLAAVFVGLRAGILDQETVSAVIVVILVTTLLASLVAARSGQRLDPPAERPLTIGRRVLVGVADPDLARPAVDLASWLAAPEAGEVLPVRVMDLEAGPTDVVAARTHLVDTFEASVLRSGAEIHPLIRLDLTPNAGLLHAAVEQAATCLVLGWRGHTTRRNAVLGEQLDVLLALSTVPVLVHRAAAAPVGPPRRVVVALDAADLARAGRRTLETCLLVAERIGAATSEPMMVITPDAEAVTEGVARLLLRHEVVVDVRPPHASLPDHARDDDIVVVGVPRALDGLGAGTARLSRSLPTPAIVAVAAR